MAFKGGGMLSKDSWLNLMKETFNLGICKGCPEVTRDYSEVRGSLMYVALGTKNIPKSDEEPES